MDNTTKFREDSHTELKREINNDFKKEIIAFANSDGGTIYVGVNDDGSIAGITEPNETMEQIGNIIRMGIKPDLSGFTSIKPISINEKIIIKVTIQRGTKRPYHLTDKGLKPSGVYYRHGVSSVPATEELIRDLIKNDDGITYDKARSLEQDLTFNYAEKFFSDQNVSFTSENRKTLNLINEDNYFTNAGLLLSDQCTHSIKCAIYEGEGKTTFLDRQEFSGSILKQLEDTYNYLLLNNKKNTVINGLRRYDFPDYPEYALRESLANAIVHRDYDYSGSIIINIFESHIEIISIGGLVKKLTIEDIMNGISQSRNTILANIFYRLRLIESYGTGIKRIMESYDDCRIKPEIKISPNSFVINLPNKTYVSKHEELNISERKILKLLDQEKTISRPDIENLLGLSKTSTLKIIELMLEKNLIRKIGSARSSRYTKP